MPSTDEDEALIASMPPGTRVAHWKFGTGVVAAISPQSMQVPVLFDDAHIGDMQLTAACFCYPSNLEIL